MYSVHSHPKHTRIFYNFPKTWSSTFWKWVNEEKYDVLSETKKKKSRTTKERMKSAIKSEHKILHGKKIEISHLTMFSFRFQLETRTYISFQ